MKNSSINSIKTYYKCEVKEEKKILTLKTSSDSINIYEGIKFIKNGQIFVRDTKEEKNEDDYSKMKMINFTIIKSISIFFSVFNNKCEIKLMIPGQRPIIKSIGKGTIETEKILFQNNTSPQFFIDFCGLDKLFERYDKFVQTYDEFVQIPDENFLKLYSTNFEKFLDHVLGKNKKRNKKLVDYYSLTYFKEDKNDKNKMFIRNKALQSFNEFIKENVLDHFKYDDLSKVILTAFKLEPNSYTIPKEDLKTIPKKDADRILSIKNKTKKHFENMIGLKIEYWVIKQAKTPNEKLYKIL